MKVLFVHPSPLMHSEIYLRLEPLGLELVAQSVRQEGHEVKLLDLQVFPHKAYFEELRTFLPDAVGFSLNYLANTPEVIDLALAAKLILPDSFIFVGGHSASFIAESLLECARGAIDCVLVGEGELTAHRVLGALPSTSLEELPGVVTRRGRGPKPELVPNIDALMPARDLTRKRHKYFIGGLDPCASIEFTRGCPWDCSFCSAWTFYGRTYRMADPRAAAENLAAIREPNVFICDDAAFVHPEHGYALAAEIERLKIRKRYYLETRADVLLRHRDLFGYWKKLGLATMFLGIEALDEETLKLFRKRTSSGRNIEALEAARKIGVVVAVNIIADPSWDRDRFEAVRNWALSVPEIVHLTVKTPYPGTEIWFTESPKLTTLDYRLFDVQHAVLPTSLPLKDFYEELVKTQSVLDRKHLGFSALRDVFGRTVSLALKGQTNFIKMLWKFNKVYNAQRQLSEHCRESRYSLAPPGNGAFPPSREEIFVHKVSGTAARGNGGEANAVSA